MSDISFNINQGEILGLLGPNGAGKSTIFNLITGLIKPDYGKILGESVRDKKVELGIAICGSGIGMSIAANKIKGIRAALCSSVEMAKLSRNHNDANILALGARFISKENAISCLKVFLREKFEAGRHIKRVKKLG